MLNLLQIIVNLILKIFFVILPDKLKRSSTFFTQEKSVEPSVLS